MKYILCYGDSNTWGFIPGKAERYEFCERWPGVMENILGSDYRVYENALNGRTTVFHDPIEEGRNGRVGFESTLLANSPLDAVIIALGVNDTKNRFSKEPWDIGWAMDLLIGYVKKVPCGQAGKEPKIIVASPALMGDDWGDTLHGTVFSERSKEKAKELGEVYKIIAQRNDCAFVDVGSFAKATGDGIHLSKETHAKIGKVMAEKIKELIG